MFQVFHSPNPGQPKNNNKKILILEKITYPNLFYIYRKCTLLPLVWSSEIALYILSQFHLQIFLFNFTTLEKHHSLLLRVVALCTICRLIDCLQDHSWNKYTSFLDYTEIVCPFVSMNLFLRPYWFIDKFTLRPRDQEIWLSSSSCSWGVWGFQFACAKHRPEPEINHLYGKDVNIWKVCALTLVHLSALGSKSALVATAARIVDSWYPRGTSNENSAFGLSIINLSKSQILIQPVGILSYINKEG